MKELLLDGNLLVALVIDTHIHHERAHNWFGSIRNSFATCAITQGTLLRVHMTMAQDTSARAAWTTLNGITEHPRHTFWELAFGYQSVPHNNLQGPKQITDAWLAELARRKKAKLMTFDKALAELHSDVSEPVP